MANYYASARSNYFKVKDEAAFRAEIGEMDVSVWTQEPGSAPGITERHFAVAADTGDENGWPSGHYNEEDEYVDIDFFDAVSKHLTDDSVAVFVEAGAEKLRYVGGYSVAVDSSGEQVVVNLDSIYDLALAKFGDKTITQAHY